MSSVTATIEISNATSARLIASRDLAFTSPVKGDLIEVTQFGFIRGTITGLDEDATYYLSAESATGARLAGVVGQFRTPPSGAHSFSFASASCSETASNSRVFDAIRERAEAGEIEFFIHTGDFGYSDVAVNIVGLFHARVSENFTSERQRACWAACPMYYIWDDHDYGGNNVGRDSPSRQAAIEKFRSRVPSPELARSGAEDAVYYSFVRGRVRFIVTDLRSERAEQNEHPSNSADQVAFTPTQRDWFFDEMQAAETAEQGIVWVNTIPWVAETEDGEDTWGGYNHARQEIADFIVANSLGPRMCIMSGDMHALAYDDGSSVNNPAGLRVMQAAALDRGGSTKGGPYSAGPLPGPHRVGVVDFTDTGSSTIGVRFRGVVVDPNDGSESTVIDETFSLTVSS